MRPCASRQRGAFICCLASPCSSSARFLFADETKSMRVTSRSQRMKSTALAVAIVATMMFAQSAHAREHHHHHDYRHHHRLVASRGTFAEPRWGWPTSGATAWTSSATTGMFALATAEASSNQGKYRGRDHGRPAAWCGWEMRHLVGADPGPSFNLARNWAHWGRSGPAGIGAVVVWPHHVGKIVGQENGHWIIESGNDGHALRTRPRSIAGAIAIRWG